VKKQEGEQGGDASSPLRTFKVGSVSPVEFKTSCSGAAVTTGEHQLIASNEHSRSAPRRPIGLESNQKVSGHWWPKVGLGQLAQSQKAAESWPWLPAAPRS
jgi:hypothetical protein